MTKTKKFVAWINVGILALLFLFILNLSKIVLMLSSMIGLSIPLLLLIFIFVGAWQSIASLRNKTNKFSSFSKIEKALTLAPLINIVFFLGCIILISILLAFNL